jgi:hypothetical protein
MSSLTGPTGTCRRWSAACPRTRRATSPESCGQTIEDTIDARPDAMTPSAAERHAIAELVHQGRSSPASSMRREAT